MGPDGGTWRVALIALVLASAFESAPAQTPPTPENFYVIFSTTVPVSDGQIVINVTRVAAPLGVDRLWLLLQSSVSYYNGNGFFRVLPDFVVQFGIAGSPALARQWKNSDFPDDPVVLSNTVGTVAYATAGPNTRTTQLFINYADNSRLDALGFAPLGTVVRGMEVAEAIYSGYAQEPDQEKIYEQGNFYLKNDYPLLDYITYANFSLTLPPPSPPATHLPAPLPPTEWQYSMAFYGLAFVAFLLLVGLAARLAYLYWQKRAAAPARLVLEEMEAQPVATEEEEEAAADAAAAASRIAAETEPEVPASPQ